MNSLTKWWKDDQKIEDSFEFVNAAQNTSFFSTNSATDINFENIKNISEIQHNYLEKNSIHAIKLLILTIFYGFIVIGGVLGNATLVVTLCSASSVRLRNPLLLAVCVADLLVTGISAPTTILFAVIYREYLIPPSHVCKVVQYMQIMPVAASTISFFLLSLDRYATVKHPRLAQLRQQRYLHASLAIVAWVVSALISTPFLFAYKRTEISVTKNEMKYIQKEMNCLIDIENNTLLNLFIVFHTTAVFIIPGLGVLLNHYGVRRKLCTLSLTARAAHGELPLPMPFLRRPMDMIIVTGIANAQQGVCNDNCSDGDIQMTPNPTVKRSSNPISPRAMREIQAHSQRHRIDTNRRSCYPAAPGIPLPQTSTLRSRRRLANMLIASSIIFNGCWAPYVFCVLYTNFGFKLYCSKTTTYVNLLIGYMYSAINPVIYWALNHNTLRQSPCAPIIRLRSIQNFLRARFRSHTIPQPSSTNEASLGPFNPKLIKSTPKTYRAQASSHYLY